MWFVVLLGAVAVAVVIVARVRRRTTGRSLEREVRTHSQAQTVRVLRNEAELRQAVSRAVNTEWTVAVRAARRAERMAGLAGDPSLVPVDDLGTDATVTELDGRPQPRQLTFGQAIAGGLTAVDLANRLPARRELNLEPSDAEDRAESVS